jgi:hypothetical protein
MLICLIHAPVDLSPENPPIHIGYQKHWVQRQYGRGENGNCYSYREQKPNGLFILWTTPLLLLPELFRHANTNGNRDKRNNHDNATATATATAAVLLLLMMSIWLIDAVTQLSRCPKYLNIYAGNINKTRALHSKLMTR